jgi:hypothetical protein
VEAEAQRLLRVSEVQQSFRARVLDGIRKFLEDQAMAGKTGARQFYEFEKELHARLMQAEREIVGSVMAASPCARESQVHLYVTKDCLRFPCYRTCACVFSIHPVR